MDLKKVLSFPSYPGEFLHPVVYACTSLMLLCLLASIITYIVHHRAIRISREGWHLLVNFCLHSGLTFTVFAGGINHIKYPIICQAVGMVLHYSSLSALLWLGLNSRTIYIQVTRAPHQDGVTPCRPPPRTAVLRLYLISGGLPLLICVTTAATDIDNYGSTDNSPYCWMAWQASLGAFYGPAAFVVMVTCACFLCTFIQLRRHPERKYELQAVTEERQRLAGAETGLCRPGTHVSTLANEHSLKAQLQTAIFTLFLFLASWVFGALGVSLSHFLDMIFSCLYGASSVTLGLFLLIQHCAKREDVWQRWWACRSPAPGDPAKVSANGDTPCAGHALLSPHADRKLSEPVQTHVRSCCPALHSSQYLEDVPQPDVLQDEAVRATLPSLPLHSCLKDRNKPRPFARYAYHMASSSLDGSVHGSHLDSPHEGHPCHSAHEGHPCHSAIEGHPCHSAHEGHPCHSAIEGHTCHNTHEGHTCHSAHEGHPCHSAIEGHTCHNTHEGHTCHSAIEGHTCHNTHEGHTCHSAHEGHTCHNTHEGHTCHSAHEGHPCHNTHEGHPCHSAHEGHSCHNTHEGHTCHNTHEGHSCHRHALCSKADSVSSSCQPEETDPSQAMYNCGKMAAENTLLPLEAEPRRPTHTYPQILTNQNGSLKGSLHQDFLYGLDSTGNIRTGPWKNETTV